MTTLAPSKVTARDPKGLKFVSIVEAAYNKAGLSEEEAQRVNNKPGLAELVSNFIAENRLTDRFKNEEVASSYGYPTDYRVRAITEQANKLRELCNGIGYANPQIAATQPLPQGTEGYFAVPRWEIIAPTYPEAVEKVFALLKKQRNGNFYNYREGELDEQHLRQTEQTRIMFQKLGDEQKGCGILVVPAQFGLRHRGRSVRRAREVFVANEFGLGAFTVGCMLLTHPEREAKWEQLHIDCAGDEFSPDAGGRFVRAPIFDFGGGRLRFSTVVFDSANGFYGSASGFLPQ